MGTAFQMPFKSCRAKSPDSYSETMGLQIVTDLPLMSFDTVAQYPDTMFFFQKDSVLIFKMPVKLFESEIYTSPDGTIDRDSLFRVGTRYEYYSYFRNNKYGWRFDSVGAERGALFSVDSLLARQTVTNFDEIYEKKMGNDSLVEESGSKRSGVYVEKYVPRVKKDETYGDSTIMTYSASLSKYHFTLSPFSKVKKGLNLQRFKLVYNGSSQSGIHSYSIPRYLLFEINELPRIKYDDIEAIYEKLLQNKKLFSGQ